MSKPAKWIGSYIVVLLTITVLHFWLNLGFDTLGIGSTEEGSDNIRFRVGFLPVT